MEGEEGTEAAVEGGEQVEKQWQELGWKIRKQEERLPRNLHRSRKVSRNHAS